MSEEYIDMNKVTKSKTDQLNTEDLLPRTMTIKITKASESSSKDQPLVLNYEGDNGKPYKPCLIMRKLMKHPFAWGDRINFVGKIITLHNDPEVFYGKEKTGGIRISGLSEIDRDCDIPVIVGRGRVKSFHVKKIEAKPLNALTAAQFTELEAEMINATTMPELSLVAAKIKAGRFDKDGTEKLGAEYKKASNRIRGLTE